MNTHKTTIAFLTSAVLGFASAPALAAVLNLGDTLTITAGTTLYSSNGSPIGVSSGSYFAFDGNVNKKISPTEKSPLSQGTTGLVIGQVTPPGANHEDSPLPGDTNAIDAPFAFLAHTGSHFTTVGVTGGTTNGLDMSGWHFAWNGVLINMGGGAWQTGTGTSVHTGATGTFANGIGNFSWSGVYGTAYSLDYRATVPVGDPSGFGGIAFEWHLEGTVVSAVPVPAAAWLLGSGMVALLGVGRRKNSARTPA